jgi:hypothetical protein
MKPNTTHVATMKLKTGTLADPGQRYLFHMTVLTSAVTREHNTSWLNAGLLRGDWGRLRLPRTLREIWQERFPELGQG